MVSKKLAKKLSFKEAIDLGEYDPSFLSHYSEWKKLSNHAKFQYVRKALDNRREHLLVQYAEVNNMLDFRLKPELQEALDNLKRKLDKLEKNREDLYIKFAGIKD